VTQPTILSIQVGLPAEHGADNISKRSWQSGIFKFPVMDKVWLDTFNLAGDGQDDLDNHGGLFRAVLGYSAEHYPTWQEELQRPDFRYGAFGENFTISGLDENSVFLGDIYTVGDARIQVTQPRLPCWKLARRWGIKDLTARVQRKGWGGWYHRVLQTGYVRAGDSYALVERGYTQYPITRLGMLVYEVERDVTAFAELSALEVLTPSWRDTFAEFAAKAA
jgi:MOSC domain-containing protein YiiM